MVIPLTAGAGAAAADAAPESVAITFGVNVPTARGTHAFKISSKTKNGRFTELTAEGDGSPINVRVGPRDSITITPTRVLGAATERLTIAYTPTVPLMRW